MGKDTFFYGSTEFGRDTIRDFKVGKDKLDFAGSGLSLADLEIGQNAAGHAVVTVKGTENRITLNKVSRADLEDNIESNIVGLSGIYGTGGDDKEETGNKLTGDGESNTIFGLAGDDELAGGAGDDELYGGDGDDELSGDAGNDTLTGGKGADTFLYGSRTFGEDVIEDFEDGTDKLNVDGADLWFSDLTIETKDGNAVVTVKNGGTITLKNISGDAIDAHDFTGLKGIHGTEDNDDGTDNPSLTGTDADDRIFGYGGNDKLYGGVGDDRLFGGGGDDDLYGGIGNDRLVGGGDKDDLYGGADKDVMHGYTGDDTFSGGEGDDELYGGKGIDTLSGDGGNDTLEGGDGTDIFSFGSREFGADIIKDFEDGAEKLNFAGSGLTLADLEIVEESGNAVVKVKGTDNKITLENISGSAISLADFEGLDGIYGTDGNDDGTDNRALVGDATNNKIFGLAGDDKLSGGAGDDELYGGKGDDTLNGDAGNDTLNGGEGSDTFVYDNKTFGVDTIEGFDVSRDKLDFDGAGLSLAWLTIEETDAGDTVIGVKNTDHKVTLKGVTGQTASTLLDNDIVVGLKGTYGTGADNKDLNGTGKVFGLAGNDLIQGSVKRDDLYGGDGRDALYGGDEADNLYGGEGNDTLYGGEGKDKLFGNSGIDTLYGDAGEDILRGGGEDDTLYGGAGNDTLSGGDGADTFSYASEEFGADIIEDFEDGTDKLDFEGSGLSLAELEIGTEDGHAVVSVRGGKSKITLQNVSASAISYADFEGLEGIYGTEGDDNGTDNPFVVGDAENNKMFGLAGNDGLYGGAGDDKLYGGDGDDTLYGEAGNDTLKGGEGADSFAFATRTFGKDTVEDFQIGQDELKFNHSGLSRADLIITEVDGDAVVTVKGTENKITLRNISKDDLEDNFEKIIVGLSGIMGTEGDDDDLDGTEGDDEIFGLGGNDTICGKGGDDEIYGGAGNDTFAYDSDTFGNDIIKDFNVDEDKLDFKPAGLKRSDVDISSNANGHVIVTVRDTGSTVTLERVKESQSVDMVFERGETECIVGDNTANTMIGFKGEDCFEGRGGNDTLYGHEGNDTLKGEEGDDTIYGGAGADRIYGGTGNDTLTGGKGRDNFVYNTRVFGQDTIKDFRDGKDKLDFTDSDLSPDDLDISENAAGHAVVTVSEGNTITLKKVSKADLEDNFEENIVGLRGKYGNSGDNDLTGTADADEIYGLGGNDTISGLGGNDELYGGDGNDRLTGGAGNDTLTGGDGDDTFAYGSRTFGTDVIADFEDGTDKLDFENSRLSRSNLTITEVDGNAVVTVSNGNTITLNGISKSELEDNFGENIVGLGIYGTEGKDRLIGTEHNDRIFGEGGDDWISGEGGDDELYGGDGDDTFAYGSKEFGHDVIKDFDAGEAGDILDFTGAGLDYDDLAIAIGDDGDVTVTVKDTGSSVTLEGIGAMKSFNIKGVDSPDGTLKCTLGTDAGETMIGDEGKNYLCAGGGDDILYGQGHIDALYGGADNDRVYGGAEADVLDGGTGNDELYGGTGTDLLAGGNGDDDLYGGDGKDRLFGGSGNDDLYGGKGADKFVFWTAIIGTDTIHDFEDGTDKLEFRKSIPTFADVEIEVKENDDGHAVVTVSDYEDWGSITILNVAAKDLTSEDFLFA